VTGQPQAARSAPPDLSAHILTPSPAATPRINGPKIYGQRPGVPFLYTVPATGDRPISFAADGLPAGLRIDASTGRITGVAEKAGEYVVTLHARNARGSDEKTLKIVIGETLSLTPALGWNSWNCWGESVDREKTLAAAKAFVSTGLVNHGWSYVNIDDAWQGKRGGEFNAIQSNEKFPDMKGLCDEVHAMGLKIGIYSTPWVTSYAGFIGGSADNPEGTWTQPQGQDRRRRIAGNYSFATNDAKQWAAWGIDYLKYDWNPRSTNPQTSSDDFYTQSETMAKALRDSGRDIIYSYSNSMPFDEIARQSKLWNSWRTTGDIRDTWWSVTRIGFGQSRWAQHSSPGHWNDPDMLVVGYVGWGPNLHPSQLTPDEQYTHISLWSLLASPLLIGCDMARMDKFTISLLSNDEVLAVNQDPLGKQATKVFEEGEEISIPRPGNRPSTRPQDFSRVTRKQVWARPLEDGSMAVGLFNLGSEPTSVTANFSDLKISGQHTARDLWRQKDIGRADGKFEATVNPHGVVFVRLIPAK
jgi:alpha-galactosidase